ncbi:P-loop containing nucleoside triphosphate hydrolase protein [Zopfochytrium polystomum]|nr:P-loop containing nucleoside triphosphate hydrolase protein [Zopfochytrium polystomum]
MGKWLSDDAVIGTARETLDAVTVPALGSQLPPKISQHRHLIGIAGIPGAGKTTLARRICEAINAHWQNRAAALGAAAGAATADKDVAVVLPMDGFHYPRSALDQMEDPTEAHRRRGAPFTFDAKALVDLVDKLRTHPNESFRAPSFDHAVGDPIPEAIAIETHHRIILMEGLYLHMNTGDWDNLVFDELWFVDCPKEVAAERLIQRHVETGVAKDRESAAIRVHGSDMQNADIILSQRKPMSQMFVNG